MALTATCVGEVNTGGNDLNAGFYDGSLGTAGGTNDRAFNNSPIIVDGTTISAVVHTTVTQVNVTGYTVVAGDVGNVFRVTGGTGTAGLYRITVVDTVNNRWTVDVTPGAAAVTLTGRFGGACLTPGQIWGLAVSGCWVYAKGSTTLSSSTANVAGGYVVMPNGTSAVNVTRFIGYTTTRGDGGRYTITNAAFAVGSVLSSGYACAVDNFLVNGNSQKVIAFTILADSRAMNCRAINLTGGTIAFSGGGTCFSCEVETMTGSTGNYGFTTASYFCTVKSCSGVGFNASPSIGCIANGCNIGFDITGYMTIIGCTAYNGTSDGFRFASASGEKAETAINCISSNNAGWGFNVNTLASNVQLINCAHFTNTSGGMRTANLTNAAMQNVNPTALSASPFVSAGTNFGLNSTAGGGAACKATTVTFAGLSPTVSRPDLGAVQTLGGTSGAAISLIGNGGLIG